MLRRLHVTTAALLVFPLLFSCQPTSELPSLPSQNTLILYDFDRSAFLELSEDFQIIREISFSFPVNCGLYDVSSATLGAVMAVELSCPNGQTVLFLDTESDA